METQYKCKLFSHKLSHVPLMNLLLRSSLFCNAQDPGSVFSQGKSWVYAAEGEQGPTQPNSGGLHLSLCWEPSGPCGEPSMHVKMQLWSK